MVADKHWLIAQVNWQVTEGQAAGLKGLTGIPMRGMVMT